MTATYLNHDYGFTITAGGVARVWVSWENIAGTGPNHGVVIFAASPLPRQQGEIKLVTYDTTKCRRSNGPVFYEFSVRSASEITASYSLEMVWGDHDEAGGNPPAKNW